MDFLRINGHKIEVKWHRSADRQRPVLVFLHQGLGCVDLWKDFPEKLADMTRCPAFSFSRLGYGGSDKCRLPRKVNFMHTEAISFLPRIMDAAGIQKHIIIGHSDGGSIGIIYTGYHQPPRQLGLITMAAHVFCEPVTVEAIEIAGQRYKTGDLKSRLEPYHKHNTEYAFRGWNDVWLNPVFMHFNIQRYLSRIHVPVLAIQGKQDPYGSDEQIRSIRKNCPAARTVLLESCQHSPHVSHPEASLSLMAQFIRKAAAD